MNNKRNATYTLGTVLNGQIFIYAALGEFKTADAAVNRCREAKAVVFEQWEVFSACSPTSYGRTEYAPVASCLGLRSVAA